MVPGVGKEVLFSEVVLGVGNNVLFREVSSVHECPYREVPLYV